MSNLTSLFPPNYKNLEQKDAVKLLEDIYTAAEEQDKGCEYCNGLKPLYENKSGHIIEVYIELDGTLSISCPTDDDCEYLGVNFIINCCPNCGRDLRKEENK